jgi:DNA polymerase-3 subunit epsilon
MHRKLHDINEKQFSIDELCKLITRSISDRNSTTDAYKEDNTVFFKIKV